MRLLAFRHADAPEFEPFHADFSEPGGTIGRCAGNDLVLPAKDDDMCRLQAAIKIDADNCYFLNLSGMTEVRINGHQLRALRQFRLDPGDEVVIGPYTLRSMCDRVTAA